MEVINAGMRKGIKLMCKASQTMQFLYLMPKPQDFVTRIVGDVVYLSAGVKKLSDDMNKLLDSYADIPANYLMTQMNSITGSLTGIVDRVSTYAQNAVNQTVGLGENAVNIVTELTGDAIDLTGSLTSAIVSLGSAVTETSTLVLGNTDKAEDIYDATDVILEWTGDGFKNVNEKATAPLKKASQKLVDTRTGITSKIDEKASKINDTIEAPQRWVESLITQLREKMQKLYNVIDGGFKDVTGMTSVSSGSSKVTEALLASGDSSKATQATVAMTTVVSEVIKNFSIGKMIGAFAGVLTQSVIVRLGLDELPPIDFESMMCRIRDDMTVSNEELYNRYDKLLESTYNDPIMVDDEMSQVKEEERNYSAKNYKEFISAYNEELKTQRDNIRTQMKNATLQSTQAESQATKKELKSAIKEVEKYRKQINRAKKASDLKESIGAELDNLKQEAEYRCNTLKSDWQSMMQQYKDAINEIKEFFMNGGSCDRFIDDCCDAINKDFDDIKSLPMQLSA